MHEEAALPREGNGRSRTGGAYIDGRVGVSETRGSDLPSERKALSERQGLVADPTKKVSLRITAGRHLFVKGSA